MKRVLIIEDDRSIAELERDYLNMNGFDVDIAYHGDEGFEKAREEAYDLLLVDIMLPGMDGFDIVRRLRESTETPIMMISAKKEDIDKIRGLGLGANDYVVKPFSPAELVARVKAHIARFERLTLKNGKDNAVINAGPIAIETHSRRVFNNEREITLTNKEFDLLLFLAQNPNHVFSKDELFDKVWGLDSLGDAATVTVHINRIREKLGIRDNQEQFIETVWGAGYRFND